MNKILAGSLAGFAATAPMTAVMAALHQRLPLWERHSLPPHHITMELAERVGIKHHLDDEARIAATWTSHFVYGAAGGAVYAPLAAAVPAPAAVKGMAYGLIVWTASYLGWLPAAGILSSATQHPERRNALMIAAHLVWGATLGVLAEKWGEE